MVISKIFFHLSLPPGAGRRERKAAALYAHTFHPSPWYTRPNIVVIVYTLFTTTARCWAVPESFDLFFPDLPAHRGQEGGKLAGIPALFISRTWLFQQGGGSGPIFLGLFFF
jgi:hypothetical protein